MTSIFEYLSGKKTYIIALLVGVGAVLVQLGIVIPEWAWGILGAAGLASVRDAISKLKP